MVVNRVGDLGIALAIALIYFVFKTVNFNVFLPIVHLFADQTFI